MNVSANNTVNWKPYVSQDCDKMGCYNDIYPMEYFRTNLQQNVWSDNSATAKECDTLADVKMMDNVDAFHPRVRGGWTNVDHEDGFLGQDDYAEHDKSDDYSLNDADYFRANLQQAWSDSNATAKECDTLFDFKMISNVDAFHPQVRGGWINIDHEDGTLADDEYSEYNESDEISLGDGITSYSDNDTSIASNENVICNASDDDSISIGSGENFSVDEYSGYLDSGAFRFPANVDCPNEATLGGTCE